MSRKLQTQEILGNWFPIKGNYTDCLSFEIEPLLVNISLTLLWSLLRGWGEGWGRHNERQSSHQAFHFFFIKCSSEVFFINLWINFATATMPIIQVLELYKYTSIHSIKVQWTVWNLHMYLRYLCSWSVTFFSISCWRSSLWKETQHMSQYTTIFLLVVKNKLVAMFITPLGGLFGASQRGGGALIRRGAK